MRSPKLDFQSFGSFGSKFWIKVGVPGSGPATEPPSQSGNLPSTPPTPLNLTFMRWWGPLLLCLALAPCASWAEEGREPAEPAELPDYGKMRIKELQVQSKFLLFILIFFKK